MLKLKTRRRLLFIQRITLQSSSKRSGRNSRLLKTTQDYLTMVARAAAKKGSVWLSDPSTYPLLCALGAATLLCAATGVRHLTTSPDVKWDREVRKHPDMALKDRSEWRSHRKYISSLHSNAVNAYHDK